MEDCSFPKKASVLESTSFCRGSCSLIGENEDGLNLGGRDHSVVVVSFQREWIPFLWD